MSHKVVNTLLWILTAIPPLFAFASPSLADDKGMIPVPDYSGDLWKRSNMSGDWGGVRNIVGTAISDITLNHIQQFPRIKRLQ